MPHSMTGVGLASGPTEVGDLSVEVRTVNGRSLVQKLRVPSICSSFEAAIELAVRQRLRRGTVTVVIERKAAAPGAADTQSIQRAAQELRDVAHEAGLPPPTLADVMAWVASAARREAQTSRPLPARVGALVDAALDVGSNLHFLAATSRS